MTQKKILSILSIFFTAYGFGAFVIGIFTGYIEMTQVGLLAMILGELIDIPKRK